MKVVKTYVLSEKSLKKDIDKFIVDFISKDTGEVRDFISKIETIFEKINNYEVFEIIKIHKLENPNKEN